MNSGIEPEAENLLVLGFGYQSWLNIPGLATQRISFQFLNLNYYLQPATLRLSYSLRATRSTDWATRASDIWWMQELLFKHIRPCWCGLPKCLRLEEDAEEILNFSPKWAPIDRAQPRNLLWFHWQSWFNRYHRISIFFSEKNNFLWGYALLPSIRL